MSDWEDYYEILGVKPDASQEEIKEAYRNNAFFFHPDRIQGLSESARKLAEEKMKKLNQAYQVLRDPQKRQQYHAEWLRQKGSGATAFQQQNDYAVPKPEPVVSPSLIDFGVVNQGDLQQASFIIQNVGGPYSKIWFSNPKSWVNIISYASLSKNDDELPLRVNISAKGKEWNKIYSEVIKVRLDDVETQVRIKLRTKPKKTRTRSVSSSYSQSGFSPPRQAASRKNFLPYWAKYFFIIPGILILAYLLFIFYSAVIVRAFEEYKPLLIERGNIYVADVYKGTKKKLILGNMGNSFCFWSPDGKKIAFLRWFKNRPLSIHKSSYARVCMADADGNNVRIISDDVAYDYAWSPDGKKIAYVKWSWDLFSGWHYNAYLVIVNVGSKEAEKMMFPLPKESNSESLYYSSIEKIAWSPDGKRIAFINSPRKKGLGDPYLYVIDASFKHLRRIIRANDFAWAPDSKRIAASYCSRHYANEVKVKYQHFSVVYLETGIRINLVPPPEFLYRVMANSSRPKEIYRPQKYQIESFDWSPDGKKIIFSTTKHNIYLLNSNNSSRFKLTQGFLCSGYNSKNWSPDGKKIAFFRESKASKYPRLYIINLDGSHCVKLANSKIFSWSPDGKRIAFKDGHSLWLANANGTHRIKLAERCFSWIQWSPDGRKIAYH